ncbi:enoyl-CoA-hydratase DpgB [Streptomyces sp. G5(2025)]|uniref:enoyl-CoA-hydratase DpgB n=1 Tax=Streptomyces sp. G5(2025) TaxID=3406628 RepID=UPI003C258136
MTVTADEATPVGDLVRDSLWDKGILRLRLDQTQGMEQLTKTLTEFREWAEDERATAALIELLPGRTDWPGLVGIHAVNKWERALRQWERLDAVTLVTASGRCTGPAFDLLMAADVRLAAPDLCIALPTGPGGFWPGMAVHRLAHRAGVSRARRLILCMAGAGTLEAVQAKELDVVDEITGELDDRVAKVLAGCRSGVEARLLRGLILDAPGIPFEDALGTHLAACDRALRAAAAGLGTGEER